MLSAGDWMRLAEQVEALQVRLGGTVLAPHWPQSLDFLRRDCLEQAGMEGEREVERWQEEHPLNRRAA